LIVALRTVLFAVGLSLIAVPAAAQNAPAPPVEVPEVDDGEGLSGSVTDDSAWQDLGIAIPAFATNANRPTPANSQGTGALGIELGRVVFNDLRNNGLFKPVGPDALPRPGYPEITAPAWGTWQGRSAEMLVHGYVRAGDDGRLTVGCYLYDVQLQQELVREGWVVAAAEWRRAAHKCADLVYSRLSGESPFFDSRIAYIAETGPKDARVKRLAIMDSDGANHRFITNGQSTALTPRYSPDYSKVAYVSYLNGYARIYVYDIGSGSQTLVTQSQNPTFAPRWSPDGRTILYSMAVAGNTDIYRVPASGGTPTRLTDGPGIDVGGSYSPDGSKIVFESDRSGGQQIYVMNADGSNQQRISFGGGRYATPVWSPRGDLIAFTKLGGGFRIGIMSPSGGGEKLLTNDWQDEGPSWSPNGRVINFYRSGRGSGGKADLWSVDLTGVNERKIPTPLDGSDPAWGPLRP
jgi:TolB protein